MISLVELRKAYSRIRPFIKDTPVVSPAYLNNRFDAEFFVKSEQFQEIGAFKIRGAANFSLQLSEEERAKGFVTHSSGNHAQAVACMASKLGTKAYIVMPHNSNKVKIANAKKWGAEVHFCEPNDVSRTSTAQELVEKTGGTLIPPFDHEWIIQGQATAAMELLAEVKELDYMITPLGGGGLLSGTTLAMHYLSPNTKVIGVEPEQAADGYEGLKSGTRVTSYKVDTVADGLRTMVGEIPFGILDRHLSDVWLAREKDIVSSMYEYWAETKHIIEPSCAVPLAALDAHKKELKGKRIGIIITGGNVDFTALPLQT